MPDEHHMTGRVAWLGAEGPLSPQCRKKGLHLPAGGTDKANSSAVPKPGDGNEDSALKQVGRIKKKKKKEQNGFMHFLHNAPM